MRRDLTAFLRRLGLSRTVRTLSRSITAEGVDRLRELGRMSRRVLCVDLSERDEECIEILRQGGTKPVVVGTGDFGNWMVRHGQMVLDRLDLLVVGHQVSPRTMSLLHGRIAAATTVAASTVARSLVQGGEMAWGSPDWQVEGLAVYRTPPMVLIDPGSRDRHAVSLAPWFRRSEPFRVPERMPSGRDWPRISIVTVTLNQAAFLEETLRSVLMQGYPNLEYIVLDGQSTDGTPDILKRYADNFAFWRSEKDDGQADALNKGFVRATGDILAWLNSDDQYLPETLIRVALAFDTYDADIVVGGCELMRDRGASAHQTHHCCFDVGTVDQLPVQRLLDVDGAWLKGDFFWQPEVFWRRSVWERAGACLAKDLYYCMDYDLWVRMAQANATIVHIPDNLAVFRFHDGQKTSGGETLPYIPELRRVSGEYLAALMQPRPQ